MENGCLGQDIAYGMLAVCSGLVGYLSVRAKNHTMATASFSLSAVGAMLAVVPFISAILPMAPLISAGGKSTTSASEPVEVDLALAIVSMLQVRAHLTRIYFTPSFVSLPLPWWSQSTAVVLPVPQWAMLRRCGFGALLLEWRTRGALGSNAGTTEVVQWVL